MNFFKPKFWDKNQVSIFSILLMPIALLIRLLSMLKRALTKSNQSSIPIICVGNIYIGGTGKTPISINISEILKNLIMNSGQNPIEPARHGCKIFHGPNVSNF